MSIYGIGIDLCEIKRIERSLERNGDLFANKVLHQNEKVHFDKLKFKARFLAKRFAAKEAFAKALGTGIADGVSLPSIEVYNDDAGKPWINLHDGALQKLQLIGETRIHLSISDERELAMAQVIIECI
ncbi:holo-ACP synthase [Aliikangiella sp. IMCC44359]|uniref:holo-ACP synthase n=1 Tax=Aliikangiella sp. IMCC44359 TaxID=3459125 RepID=UPI00403AB789